MNRCTWLDKILHEDVPRQSLEPCWISRSYSKVKVTWVFVFVCCCVHEIAATRRQYLALSKASRCSLITAHPFVQVGSVDSLLVSVAHWHSARCKHALSLIRLSVGPGFNPQTRQNKLFHVYWRSCFEINFSDRQEGLTVSSIICGR